ncbi:MAG: phosphate ABC transporter substrate-binding protein PstS family protein [Cyanobacteriota bacterium]|nr:phosphate ABC transporter substrate-binding protein PstS family protein [Cyanobacteriota bacterium]
MLGWKFITVILAALLLAACGDRSEQKVIESTPQEAREETEAKELPNPEVSPTAQPVALPQTLPEEGIQLPEVDPLDVEGDLSMAGSSTVFPLSQAIYDRFIQYGYAGRIKLDSIGSGAGFRLFCEEGESDISNASRPIKEEEVQACTGIGRQPIEFRVGTDALAVVVNPANQFVTNVTREELAALFTAQKWSDVNPDWPDEAIERFVPGEDSGTFDFFVEEVLDEDKQKLLNATNTELSEDDNYIEENIASNANAIGFFGYAYYKQNANELKILSIEGITPSAEAVESGDYILARPLLIYSDAKIIRNKPQVGEFISFYLSNVNRVIEEVGYFPSSQQALDEAKTKLLEAIE